jgi:hypothetical protein
LTGLESAVWQLTIFVFICKTDKSKPVKQEVNGTVILTPLEFPGLGRDRKKIMQLAQAHDEICWVRLFTRSAGTLIFVRKTFVRKLTKS